MAASFALSWMGVLHACPRHTMAVGTPAPGDESRSKAPLESQSHGNGQRGPEGAHGVSERPDALRRVTAHAYLQRGRARPAGGADQPRVGKGLGGDPSKAVQGGFELLAGARGRPADRVETREQLDRVRHPGGHGGVALTLGPLDEGFPITRGHEKTTSLPRVLLEQLLGELLGPIEPAPVELELVQVETGATERRHILEDSHGCASVPPTPLWTPARRRRPARRRGTHPFVARGRPTLPPALRRPTPAPPSPHGKGR